MTDKTTLGDRMKSYEQPNQMVLVPRSPLIIRVDGKAFHTFTRDYERPYSEDLTNMMNAAAVALCEEIQGAVLAYVQSDEISVLIHPYRTYESQCWFGGNLQKMVSVSASIATAAFLKKHLEIKDRLEIVNFDSRAFVLPEFEIVNYFIWRQQDCTRNSIQMLARSLYSHKELDQKRFDDLQEMCFSAGKNWNDVPTRFKRGRCIVKNSGWVVDNEIPTFSVVREYIFGKFKPPITYVQVSE